MEYFTKMESLVEKKLFSGVYYGKKVLVTGNSGFKGSWISMWLTLMGAEVLGVSLKEDYENSHLAQLDMSLKTKFINIENYELLDEVICQFQPDMVFHLAAQPIVKIAKESPIETFKTNVIGTLNLFEACRKNNIKYILNVTSDKVYKNDESKNYFLETDIIGGNDLYSASKASVEIMTESYVNTFFGEFQMKIANLRSGNVIGGGDMGAYRLIPDIIKSHVNNEVIEIRNPEAIRPWQHVLSTISGYLIVGEKLFLGVLNDDPINFNFGPLENEVYTVNSVIFEFQKKWNDLQIKTVKNNFHESTILLIDSQKARNLLGWDSIWDFQASIHKTIEWYDNFTKHKRIVSYEQLLSFIDSAEKKGTSWAQK